MTNQWWRQVLLFIILVFLQVYIFNKIHILGFITPLLYIYFIIKLPTDMNRNVVLLLSFLLGFSIDFFNYSLGVHMLASTVAGFVRYYGLQLFSPRDLVNFCVPSINIFGTGLFLRYASFVVLLHQVVLFSVESFSLLDPLILFCRIAGSSVFTLLLIYGLEQFNPRIKK
ncbi:rod shape-determining protein MreD [Bacteroidales bacterium]|nr:rod shape-determining protein MreD [Bacteroidales bacterium]